MKKLYYDPKKCTACKTCEIVCAVGHSPSQDLFTAILEGNAALPAVRVYPAFCLWDKTPKEAKKDYPAEVENYPIVCRHCKDYPCVHACIAGALEYNPEKGIIFTKERCVGCWMCIMVCPYGAVRPDKRDSTSVRCDLCRDIDSPRCVQSCPTQAILYLEKPEISASCVMRHASCIF